MNYLGLGLLPKKLSIFGLVFGINNLWDRICCANPSSKNCVYVGTFKPHINCVRYQHCFLHLKMM